MKTYLLTIAKKFPTHCVRKGEDTNFPSLITQGFKIHTLRCNYPLWKKRLDEVDRGDACLSLRCWMGRPYYSRQHEWLILTKKNGVGIQKLSFGVKSGFLIDDKVYDTNFRVEGNGYLQFEKKLAINDGLSHCDLKDWFKAWAVPIAYNKELAIIHFTNFRYEKE